MSGLLIPVSNYKGVSSWAAHQWRSPKSSEPGTDLYCPIGSHLRAPADGWIWGSGESIGPATGRWVGINFDNGMSYRSMHHSRNRITSGRVKQGDIYAFSGASGYGEEDWSWNIAETGGAHVHATLWPTHEHRFGYDANGHAYTIDLMAHIGGTAAGGFTDFLEDDMPFTDDDRKSMLAIQLALGAGGLEPGNIEDNDTILARVRNLSKEVTNILDGTGTNGSTEAKLDESNTILGVVRGLRDRIEIPAPVAPPSTLDIPVENTTINLNSRQLAVARAIVERGRERGFIDLGLKIALMTALQESKLRMYANSTVPESLTYPHDAVGEDYDSLNFFQQRAKYWGTVGQLMNERYAIDAFYDKLASIPDWWNMDAGVAAQTVQVSAFPDAYAKWADAADLLLTVY